MKSSRKKTGATLNRGGSKQAVGTPMAFVNAVEARYGPIVFDLAADAINAKRDPFFTKNDDSLMQDWAVATLQGIGWLNPEYDQIWKWARKSDLEAERGAKIAMLVPASVGSNWYRDFVFGKHPTVFINGRIKFVGHTQPYPKDLILILFGIKADINGEWLQPFSLWTPAKAELQ